MLARQQIAQHQRAGRLAADHQRVAFLEMLQTRCERPIRHLDTEELKMLLVVRAGDTVGTHQRTPFDFQTDHDELTVLETQPLVTRGLETEQRVIPVMHTEDSLDVQVAHVRIPLLVRDGASFCTKSTESANIR